VRGDLERTFGLSQRRFDASASHLVQLSLSLPSLLMTMRALSVSLALSLSLSLSLSDADTGTFRCPKALRETERWNSTLARVERHLERD